MRFGIFYEHQLPRPWDEGAELRLVQDALDQVELADRLGIEYVWEVEHHFLEEYSHSSAPEVFLAAASQRTHDIRLGHGIIQTAPRYNHPVRTAERLAMLDLVSGGRVEFGSGESSSTAELGGFGVDPAQKRDAWREGLEVAIRGAIGTPGQLREFLRRYEDVGVDQIIFVMQAGRNRHEHIMESLELFGAEVLPEFKARDEKLRAAKAVRLEPAIEAAMARRVEPDVSMPDDYVMEALPKQLIKAVGGDELLETIAANTSVGDRSHLEGLAAREV